MFYVCQGVAKVIGLHLGSADVPRLNRIRVFTGDEAALMKGAPVAGAAPGN